jgi:hypothetical protein
MRQNMTQDEMCQGKAKRGSLVSALTFYDKREN